MKKFYTLVTKQKEQNGFSIRLDGKPVKAPSGQILAVVNADLADRVVQEWADQIDEIDPETMPLTQFANTAQDRVSKEREAMQKAVLKFLDTDLLCYRIDDHQENLKERQAELWNPWLEWFEEQFKTKLETTTGLAALKQDPKAHEAVRSHVEGLDDQKFTILQVVVPLAGSLVLGLAFLEGAISAEQLFRCAMIEEDFKAEIYNEDFYGRAPLEEKKNAAVIRDLKAAEDYLKAL